MIKKNELRIGKIDKNNYLIKSATELKEDKK